MKLVQVQIANPIGKVVDRFEVHVDISSDAFLRQLAKTNRHHKGMNLIEVSLNEYVLARIKQPYGHTVQASTKTND